MHTDMTGKGTGAEEAVREDRGFQSAIQKQTLLEE